MHRFFIPPECLTGESVVFPCETAHQIMRVLRLKPGQTVAVICPEKENGVEYRVDLQEVSAENVVGSIRSKELLRSEPELELTLIMALSQREKFEWMLQKCTEAGAAGFVPLISSRTLVQESEGIDKKIVRWQKILQEAAEQSGRGKIPGLFPVQSYERAVAEAVKTHDLVLIAWEREKTNGLRDIRERFSPEAGKSLRIAVIIGPEGGFSSSEVDLAVRNGVVPFSLGARILRMETAALAAAVLILYEFEFR